MANGAAIPYHFAMSQSNPAEASSSFAALRWLFEAGVDEAIGESPVNRFRSSPNSALLAPQAERPSARKPVPHVQAAASPHSARPEDQIDRAMQLAAASSTLAELKAALDAFDGCPLKQHATSTVFADGIPDKRILLIGEAPGRDEDLAGLPFVGRAGKLLDRMLASIRLDRKTNVYITNVLNWRPPNNRDPSPEEAAACLPFLRRHIELVNPAIMVLLGAVSARHVMGKTEGIMRLRGTWLDYYVNGRIVPVMPILHPAYLLRRPADKKLAWRDLQAIAAKIHAMQLLEPEATRG
ncbi:MAG TPA: uracil-DNA glycosylase [Rhizomicrobium sp.]|jgi:DNA polymerase|nr:uracil-DNA glycosylase [Rhizomicrobium sp.]